MAKGVRPERVGQEIQAAVADLLTRGELRDPRIGYITITGVKVSPDLRVARIFYSMMGTEQQRAETAKGLEAAKGFVRREVTAGEAAGLARGLLHLRPLARRGRQDRAAAEGSEVEGGLVRADGVLVVDKPKGPTSHDVVQRVRKALGGVKAGHTGTLDPMATGVLPVCVGEATKLSQFITESDKAYEATVRLGVSTDTLDAEGKVTAQAPVPALTARAAGGGAGGVPRQLRADAADVLGGEGGRQAALRAGARGRSRWSARRAR